MIKCIWLGIFVLAVVPLVAPLSGQGPADWRDPSPHGVQFVTVDDGVRLEVLDWGGSGRPVVLLSGLGNTAHVFDEFAPKLATEYHVYGITRRGYGASSVPASGYTADRLGDDVLAVLDSLKLNSPVLAGHSIAGQELSSVGSRIPDRVAGLVYLDALYSYAYATPLEMDFWRSLEELQKNVRELQNRGPDPLGSPAIEVLQELLAKNLPEVQRNLQEFKNAPQPRSAPSPGSADLESFAALRSWETRVRGFPSPEAELRQSRESSPDGRVGKSRTPARVRQAILAGEQKYTEVKVPALAIVALPQDFGPAMATSDAYYFQVSTSKEVRIKAFESSRVNARVVRLPHANHYVFMSNEADVLREMRVFVASLH